MKWNIRQEKAGDEAAIAEVTRVAFAPKAFSDGSEAVLPAQLREAGALVLSLVAEEKKSIIGHIALSPAKVGVAKWLAVGPVSVRPDRQGRGIGSALVNNAVAVARAYGRGGVVLTGDPAFYGRLGFVHSDAMTLGGKPNKHLQFIAFDGDPVGDVHFHAAFEETP